MPDLLSPLHLWREKRLYSVFFTLLLLCVSLAVLLDDPLPLILPAGLLFFLFAFLSPKSLFNLFFFLLPFSMEFELPGGLGTDLPSEQIMWILTGLTILLLIKAFGGHVSRRLYHPVTLIILVHLSWILLATLYSTHLLISFKYFLAKLWYILPFFVLPLLLFHSEADFKKVFKWFSAGTFIAVTYVMLRHAASGFAFDTINAAVRPIFRNHVNYAVMLVALLPYLIYLLFGSDKKQIWRWLVIGGFVIAIYMTYTRAAQLSMLLAVGIYFVIKWRLARIALALASVAVIAGFIYLSVNNKYLEYAPNYEKAIAHKKFDNLVEATYKMEDISTVERFYRWVAGVYMVKEKPLTGYGPASFYENYKSHTVTSYKTYVSDNPERSGIHNNYLMVAVEQGLPGLAIMLALAFLPIIIGEKVYHALRNPTEKALVMAAIVSFALIDIIILINDLLEADKVGPVYFLSAAIIVYFDHKRRSKES